jgi:hypothetical protein
MYNFLANFVKVIWNVKTMMYWYSEIFMLLKPMISFLQSYFQSKVIEDFGGQKFTYFCFQNSTSFVIMDELKSFLLTGSWLRTSTL